MCVQFAVYSCVPFAYSYNATVDAVSATLSLAFAGHRCALCLFRFLYMFVPLFFLCRISDSFVGIYRAQVCFMFVPFVVYFCSVFFFLVPYQRLSRWHLQGIGVLYVCSVCRTYLFRFFFVCRISDSFVGICGA